MAPLPEINGVHRVVFRWDYNNQVNVIHIHANTLPPASIAGLIDGLVTKEMWGVTQNGIHINQVDITPLINDAGTFSLSTGSGAKWAGKGTGDILPNCAAVLSMRTIFRGPSHRGRIYIGPMCESFNASGLVVPANRTELVSAWTAFQTGLIAVDAQMVVASYKHATATTVLAFNVRNAVGTQRRRQDRLAA